ncbi:hypothetical protein SEA_REDWATTLEHOG_163 [Gordonia phage RedWattleHog]|uniref:DUF732 domain-containing protein n=1 Tax=Gordonia phage Stormageddon TaxID=2656541 RepID=A0A649VS52_9CAUD|nr:hypothetical protein KHQ86_gp136 [Gordonia phage Stormageddon]QGJ95024.1 hypothetical protein SEA_STORMAGEDDON_164 [Gordonia phage Stormageddon]QLF83666.1 hypothetical protein SEA_REDWATTLEHOG_163 [Gordonia phage RedWattleHog]
MKKTIAALAAAAAITLATGCTIETVSEPTTTTTPAPLPVVTTTTVDTPPPPTTTEIDSEWVADRAYIAALDQQGIDYPTEQDAIDLGHSICEALDSGNSPQELIRVGVDASGMDSQDVAFMVGAAIGSICPRHDDLIPE